MKTCFLKNNKLLLAIILPLLVISFIRIVGFKGENSIDCYYHVAMADFGPSCYVSGEFPKLTMSIWSENFSDKELGYHLLLSTVRRVKCLLNFDTAPPFNLETLFFAYFAVLAFVFVLWYFKTKNILYYTLLLVIVSPFFTNRLLMLRPHNLSITLMLLSIPILVSVNTWSKLWRGVVLGFVISWCYSNPHFMLLPAFAVGIGIFIKNKTLSISWMIPASVFLGIIAGLTLHPQFPNTFINWKIQCVDVISQALFGDNFVAIGAEFKRPRWIWIIKNSGVFLIFLFDIFLLLKLQRLKTLPVQVTASGIIALITLSGVFAGIRAMEYACPYTILFTAFVLSEYHRLHLLFPRPFAGNKIPKYSKILIVVLSFAFLVFQTYNYRGRKGFRPVNHFAEWVDKSDIQANAIIANLIWSDFPFLIYSCPQFRYLSGLDPMFSYAISPDKVINLEKLRHGKIKITPKEVSEITHASYAFIRKPYNRYAQHLIKLGFVPIYKGEDGWLFDLKSQEKQPSN